MIAFWHRRDLRLYDNAGLFHALKQGKPVMPVFIFDREILGELPTRDKRVDFIHRRLGMMQQKLRELGSTLVVRYGKPEEVWLDLMKEFELEAVYTNHDYEPYAKERDEEIGEMLREKGAGFYTYKDQVIFEKEDILTNAGKPYTVYTPYSKKWLAQLDAAKQFAAYENERFYGNFWQHEAVEVPTLGQMGFERTDADFPSRIADENIIQTYDETRNFPANEQGTTRIGLHLRFGTLSVRELVRKADGLNEVYLKELIWREFYMQILWNFPHVVHKAFRPAYDRIPWRDSEADLERWKQGKTGFPLVDAGMRELNATGYMHNRVRMLVSSFLTKHLLIDWRKGEAYFAEKLLDFELASNNGGWQWASGSGCDAAPYFRIFNPELQLKKFDKKLRYVGKWIPEYGTPDYVEPMVVHKEARQRALDVYKNALNQES